jgi:LacI family transcriptional regulator
MGYCRNEVARSVVTGKTQVLGFINYGLDHDVCGKILNGFNETAADHNYYIKHINIKRSNSVKDQTSYVRSVAIQCAQQRLAAVGCCFGPRHVHATLKTELDRFKIPMASMATFYQDDKCVSIGSDELMASRLVAEHLANLGHRRVAFVVHSFKLDLFANERYEAFLNAAKEFDLQITADALYPGFDDERDGIEAMIRQMLSGQRDYTAVVCGSDFDAYLLLRVAQELKIDIPGDLSVVGYGDLNFSPYTWPRLTTINQAFDHMGAVAAKFLMACAENPKKKHAKPGDACFKLPVELVVRESTGSARTF